MKKLINTSFLYLSLHWQPEYFTESSQSLTLLPERPLLQSYIPIFLS